MAENLLQPLVRGWLGKIKVAVEHKKGEFQNDADEAMRFFNGPHNFMYGSQEAGRSGFHNEEGRPLPSFLMTLNKVAEMVQLFGPVLYHRNPQRQVNPRKLPPIDRELFVDPKLEQQVQQLQQQAEQAMQQQAAPDYQLQGMLMQLSQMLQQQTQQYEQFIQQANQMSAQDRTRAKLLEYYLNYLPNEMDLQGHSRQMIDEAIIKGMGTLWTEIYTPQGAQQSFVRSTYDSVDNLVIDPDMECLDEALWVARRRVLPVWEVEKRFQLRKNLIRGNMESARMQGTMSEMVEGEYFRQRGDTNDLLTFWEVYSRMGAGHRMQETIGVRFGPPDELLEQFGDYIYLAVCEDYPWPLNLPEDNFEQMPIEQVFYKLQWPIPFWADHSNPWPFSELAFHRIPRKIWPMSHLKPGLGELKFLNWAFSFLADKIKNTSRDFIGIMKSAGEDIRTAILSGRDLTLLEIEKTHGTIGDVVQFLQHPELKDDIWKVIEAVLGLFEQRVGLNELMYGQSRRQMRSAAEAQAKRDMIQIRPDDMAMKVEQTMTTVARKEALATRWFITAKDVAPIVGPGYAQLWQSLVEASDVHTVVSELEYRIEAGSVRKPNRDRDIENANNSMQQLAPIFAQFAQATGQFGPINALIEMWGKAHDVETERFLLQPPPPPTGPSPEELELQLEQQKAELEAQLAQQKAQLDAQQGQQKLQLEQARFDLERDKMILEMRLEQQKHAQELRQDEEVHDQEIRQSSEAAEQKSELARQDGELKIKLARQQAASKASSNSARGKPR